MITFEGPQCMWTNPSQKIQARVRPPHSGNACILGLAGPATHPLGEKNGGGASVRTSLGERLYASVLQRQVGRAETPGERNVIKE